MKKQLFIVTIFLFLTTLQTHCMQNEIVAVPQNEVLPEENNLVYHPPGLRDARQQFDPPDIADIDIEHELAEMVADAISCVCCSIECGLSLLVAFLQS